MHAQEWGARCCAYNPFSQSHQYSDSRPKSQRPLRKNHFPRSLCHNHLQREIRDLEYLKARLGDGLSANRSERAFPASRRMKFAPFELTPFARWLGAATAGQATELLAAEAIGGGILLFREGANAAHL